MQSQTNHTPPQTGTIVFIDGLLVFSLCKETQLHVTALGVATVESFRRFTRYIDFIQLPIDTPADKVSKVYHNYTLHALLSKNGIDMHPVDRPAQSNVTFLEFSAKNLRLVNTVSKYARNFIDMVAGFFNSKPKTI